MKHQDTTGSPPDMRAGANRLGPGQLGEHVSFAVVGCGVLIFLSFAIPYFQPPFGEGWYIQWLAGGAVVLGAIAILRRERGPFAAAAVAVTLFAAALFVFTIVFPMAYSTAMGVLMPD